MQESVTAKPFSSSFFFISAASRWALPVWEPKSTVTSRSTALRRPWRTEAGKAHLFALLLAPRDTTPQASQIAAQPDHLIGRQRGQQLVQGFRLLLVERAVSARKKKVRSSTTSPGIKSTADDYTQHTPAKATRSSIGSGLGRQS